MASNAFGNLFKITTFGESHGKAMGVVIDGCPAGVPLTETIINNLLKWRAPGQNAFTSPRKETDLAEIYAGVFEGKTTGAPIAIIIPNRDADSSKYEALKNLYRPGHANFTYLHKYGCYDYRGGGRASARETVCRVAAAAVAQQLLQSAGIEVVAYLNQVGDITMPALSKEQYHLKTLQDATYASPIFCPDATAAEAMMHTIEQAKAAGDSIGGVVSFVATGLPIGLGDPVYEKLDAKLAQAMLSLPASKAFEIGEGLAASQMLGSEHNDLFTEQAGRIQTATNHAGGLLGGISNGMPLTGKVTFKAPSSINQAQATVNLQGQPAIMQLPAGSRHDPCVAIRAVPVVAAMVMLVLADALLLNRSAQLKFEN